MKILALVLVLLLGSLSNTSAHASLSTQGTDALHRATQIYISAAMCKSVYSDRSASALNELKKYYALEEEPIKIASKTIDTTFYLSKIYDKQMQKNLYIICFRGSETNKDWKINLKYGKVPYSKQIDNDNVKPTTPLVHEGFLEYTDNALRQTTSDHQLITELLANDTDSDILITGHSLGGAIATLYTARLIDLGINPNRISTITFGAPAVGNPAFAEKYKNKFNLLRITASQDLIAVSLQKLVGNYTHFGTHIKLSADTRELDYIDQHNMSFYLNKSIMYFIDALDASVKNSVTPPLVSHHITPDKPLVAVTISSTDAAQNLPNDTYLPTLLALQIRNILPSYLLLPNSTTTAHNIFDNQSSSSKVQLDSSQIKYLLKLEIDSSDIRLSRNKALILNYSIVDNTNGHTIATGYLSSSLSAHTGMLQILLQNISNLPIDFLL